MATSPSLEEDMATDPSILAGESHGQRSLQSIESDMTEAT